MDAVNKLKIVFRDFRIIKYINRDESFIKELINIRKLSDLNFRIRVELFDSIETIEKKLSHKVPKWFLGTYVGKTIYLLDYSQWKYKSNSSMMQILVHEYVHILINSIAGDKCPIWLNEGLAINIAKQYTKRMISIPKKNIYELSYKDHGFYDICGALVNELIREYSIETIINKIKVTSNFEKDRIFSNDNVLKIALKIKGKL